MHHRIQSVSELFFVMFMYFAIIYEPKLTMNCSNKTVKTYVKNLEPKKSLSFYILSRLAFTTTLLYHCNSFPGSVEKLVCNV